MGLKETQVFTPEWVTRDMIDMLLKDQPELLRQDETFVFEPSCGDGSMLKVIVERIYNDNLKKFDGDKLKAIARTLHKFYAIELDPELVPKARARVFEYIDSILAGDEDFKILCSYLIAEQLRDCIENRDFFEFMKTDNFKKVKVFR